VPRTGTHSCALLAPPNRTNIVMAKPRIAAGTETCNRQAPDAMARKFRRPTPWTTHGAHDCAMPACIIATTGPATLASALWAWLTAIIITHILEQINPLS